MKLTLHDLNPEAVNNAGMLVACIASCRVLAFFVPLPSPPVPAPPTTPLPPILQMPAPLPLPPPPCCCLPVPAAGSDLAVLQRRCDNQQAFLHRERAAREEVRGLGKGYCV